MNPVRMAEMVESADEGGEIPPAGVRFHPGHTWVRLVSMDLALVGSTRFAVSFAGTLAGISLPGEFTILRRGNPAWTFTSTAGRRLSQVSPVGGQVLAVNPVIQDDPGGLHRSPYRAGWMLCIRSPDLLLQMRNLLSREPDLLGLERLCKRMVSVLGTALRLPNVDGKWSPFFGDDFDAEEWESLRREFFPGSGSPSEGISQLETSPVRVRSN